LSHLRRPPDRLGLAYFFHRQLTSDLRTPISDL
jgi:hypothetical protein